VLTWHVGQLCEFQGSASGVIETPEELEDYLQRAERRRSDGTFSLVGAWLQRKRNLGGNVALFAAALIWHFVILCVCVLRSVAGAVAAAESVPREPAAARGCRVARGCCSCRRGARGAAGRAE
jgi:hypothetical protein